jgi:ankyrin repeat protein
MDLAPIQTAIQQGDAIKVRELLTAHPHLLEARTPQGTSLVSLACYYRQPAIAATFSECGAVLDIFDACAIGDEPRVRALAEQFPESINAHSPDGFYPLGLAAFFGHPAIVEYLLDSGADVNQSATNALKVAPIHAAVSQGDLEIVRLLIARGADVNARQQGGITPLHGAAGAGRNDIVDVLLAHKADPAALSDDCKTPADLAAERGHPATADLLRRAMI